MFQNNKDENVRALTNVDAFTCAVGVDDYTMYSKSSSLQVKFIFFSVKSILFTNLNCLVWTNLIIKNQEQVLLQEFDKFCLKC